jgi:hypothetical protein
MSGQTFGSIRNPVFVAISNGAIIETRLVFGSVFRIGVIIGHVDPIED